MRRAPVFVAATAMSLLVLTACSDGSDGSGSATTSRTTASAKPTFDVSTVKADDSLHSLLPQRIQDSGVLNVATSPNYAPAEFLADDGKTQIGYDMDLIRAVGARLGVKVVIHSADLDSIVPAVGSTYDLGISSFTITDALEKQVNMISYFNAGEAFAVLAGNPKNLDPANVCGQKVAVQAGTLEESDIAKTSEQCAAAGKGAVDVLSSAAQKGVTENLLNGKVDIMFADSSVVGFTIEQTGGKIEQLGKVVATAPQGIVVSKNDSELAEAVQKAVQSLIDDKTYANILNTWNNTDGAVDKAELNPPTR